MSEHMGVRVEVWPISADAAGFWLLSGNQQWMAPGRVPADDEPESDVAWLLSTHEARASYIHSTSWRTGGPNIVLTYIAVIDLAGEPVRSKWRDALPIEPGLLMDQVGAPKASPPLHSPNVRHLDVLLHAIRHLAYLADHDGEADVQLDDMWHRHLVDVRPELARMFLERDAA